LPIQDQAEAPFQPVRHFGHIPADWAHGIVRSEKAVVRIIFNDAGSRLCYISSRSPIDDQTEDLLLVTGKPTYEELEQKIGALEEESVRGRRAEEALQKSEERYRTLVENASDLIYRMDAAGHIAYVNPAGLRASGYALEELIGRHYLELIRSDKRDEASRFFGRQFVEKIENLYSEFPVITKDGHEICLAQNTQLIVEDGQVTGFQSISRDITARQREDAEQRLLAETLRESEAKFRSLVEYSLEGIMIIDMQGKLLFVNDIVAQALEAEDRASLIGRNMMEFIAPESVDDVVRDFLDVAQGNGGYLAQYYTIANSGKKLCVECIGKLITYDGVPADLISIRDVTSRKQAEEEKRTLEERLNRAEKMEALGTLAGGVAHDLNNVLGIVVGYAELLLHEPGFSSAVRSYLTTIMTGCERAAAIVQDLLTLARRGVAGKTVLNLNDLINDSQSAPEFVKLYTRHPKVKIGIDLEPGLLNVSGSYIHLVKTIFNLISNAYEAMPDGGSLAVRTANRYLDKPVHGYEEVREGDYVVLSVSDTGEGIAAADLKRIFEPFYTKKVMGRSGTGLGLSVVWGTVKDHDGYIDVESVEGKGSTFTIHLPASREDVTAETAAVPLAEYMGEGESILVVDDVEGQRNLATRMLAKLNYRAVSVASGEEAVAYLMDRPVDLMVLDMIMDPGMDGLDTYRSVLQIRPGQKAIIVSGFSETDRVRAAQAAGAGAYVKKPYVMETLGLAVKKELRKK
jgi:PAS domain S-box-containing protein